MSQSPRACPSCGTPVPAGQRFCNNCGTDLQAGQVAPPASQYGGPMQQGQQGQQPYAQAPYGQQPYGQFGQPPIQPYQQPQQQSSPIVEALGALGLLFFARRYMRRRPGYRPRRQSSGCCGCLVLLVILGIVFGIPAYVYYKHNPNVIQQIQNQIQNSNNGNSGTVPSTQPPITTIKTGQTVTYAGVDITIIDVKQSMAFLGDTNTATNGVIRLDVKESGGQRVGSYSYGDVFRLILPDGTTVSPIGEENNSSPQAATSRDNWVDFPVSTSIKPDQIQLLLGTPQEAQIKFLLTGKVDPQFLPITATLNIPISYGGVNWTLKMATSSLSINGNQATTGMRYVVLTFNLDNPTSQTSNTSFTGDYMRLKAGDTENRPTDSKLPDATANTSGLSGTVTFLMPNNGNAFTLILLVSHGIDPQSNVQVNTDFMI